jgi:phosphate acetyltransferase
MDLLAQIREKEAAKSKNIVLAEGTEERTLQAIKGIVDGKIANPILLGDESEVKALASKIGADITGAEIINPVQAPFYDDFVQEFYEMRKSKGVDLDKAKATMQDPLFFASMMVQMGKADGEVAGDPWTFKYGKADGADVSGVYTAGQRDGIDHAADF